MVGGEEGGRSVEKLIQIVLPQLLCSTISHKFTAWIELAHVAQILIFLINIYQAPVNNRYGLCMTHIFHIPHHIQ